MQTGFWSTLKKPIMALAPMANVTDAAFRKLIAKYGKPDVMWTEFVSCDGLCSSGKESLLVDFWYGEVERPIVAQIFGSKPDHFYATAQLVQELGFDGIDINMGCPDRNVEKQGAGAALIKTPELAKELIRATMKGAGNLPVSVKTRIGYGKNTIDEWMKHLLDTGLAAITLHGRARKDMSLVPADWNAIARGVQLAKEFGSDKARTLILGNGDVATLADAHEHASRYGVDGVMIGRGIFGNPWCFTGRDITTITVEERLAVMIEHTLLFDSLFRVKKHFDVMKKHYKAYVSGFDGAKELRIALMETKSADEVIEVVMRHYPSVKVAC